MSVKQSSPTSFTLSKFTFVDLWSLFMKRITYTKFIQQFRQIKITRMFIHMNVGRYGLAALIRIASSPFGVFQENNYHVPTRFQIREYHSASGLAKNLATALCRSSSIAKCQPSKSHFRLRIRSNSAKSGKYARWKKTSHFT